MFCVESKRVLTASLVCLAALLTAGAEAQTGTGSTQPAGQKTLAATMGVYVYPTKGQTAEQQSQAAQQATQQQFDDFKRAFSVCLEAKDYMVK